MPPDPTQSTTEERVVAAWIALLRQGAPVNVEFPRRIWDNAIRTVADVGSQGALRYHTRAARDMVLIEIKHGNRTKQGTVKLLPPNHPDQFIPLLEGKPPDELIPQITTAPQETETPQPTTP